MSSNTITLPLRLAVLRYSFWSSRDSRLLLTRGKPPQRALDIQEHLVVVLVIVSLYGFWKQKKRRTICCQLDKHAAHSRHGSVAIVFCCVR